MRQRRQKQRGLSIPGRHAGAEQAVHHKAQGMEMPKAKDQAEWQPKEQIERIEYHCRCIHIQAARMPRTAPSSSSGAVQKTPVPKR